MMMILRLFPNVARRPRHHPTWPSPYDSLRAPVISVLLFCRFCCHVGSAIHCFPKGLADGCCCRCCYCVPTSPSTHELCMGLCIEESGERMTLQSSCGLHHARTPSGGGFAESLIGGRSWLLQDMRCGSRHYSQMCTGWFSCSRLHVDLALVSTFVA
ncbi:hypothetical protein F4680DRAFT_12635 [Xylaria scruposa]|nr:hypothetical protein F4680DRAFT_12635 [Xylaria scruposa]